MYVLSEIAIGWTRMNLSPLLATVKLSIKPGRGRKIKLARRLTKLTAHFINMAPMKFQP